MNDFTTLLLNWYANNPRKLAWKNHQDAYSIWLSEIIMQQTRVEYGTKYYIKFKRLFPTVEDLANADISEILKEWEGLGYYSRARNLHHTANIVANDLNGEFPTSYTEIQKLKGIGAYTGAAILSFAYNQPIPAIDGNAFRVLSRYFGLTEPIDVAKNKKLYFDRAQSLLNQQKNKAGDFNQAMMNFGAMVCKPKKALCETCPFNTNCVANLTDQVYSLPVKKKKASYKKRYFTFFCVEHNGEFLIEERTKKDVWQNLYQFYLIENAVATPWETVLSNSEFSKIEKESYTIKNVFHELQTLTHQKLSAEIVWLKFSEKPTFNTNGNWVVKKDIDQYPFPKMLQNIIKMITLEPDFG